MTRHECECDQPVALPHCEATRCDAPYAEPPVQVDHNLRACVLRWVGSVYLVAFAAWLIVEGHAL